MFDPSVGHFRVGFDDPFGSLPVGISCNPNYKQMHIYKCLAVPVSRLGWPLSEEHLLGSLERSGYQDGFPFLSFSPFVFISFSVREHLRLTGLGIFE